jgi:chromosome segregation ATPase
MSNENFSQDMSVKILAQTSENIQKLFDLSIRIDERVKLLQEKQENFDDRLETIQKTHSEMMQKLAVLESKSATTLKDDVDECYSTLRDLDKRLTAVESVSKGFESKWQELVKFVIQLVWIVLAAWALYKFGLNPPPVP